MTVGGRVSAVAAFVAVLSVACLGVAFAASKKKSPSSRGKTKCDAPLMLENKNAALQKALAIKLRASGFQRYIDRKQLGVALVDLSSSGRRYYAGLNDDLMMYAASLPKIAILLTIIDAVEHNRLEWTQDFDKRLQNMITKSSNPDASWGTDIVGLLAIEKVMRDPRYCFYDDEIGGLWVGRAYRRGAAENREHLKNLSHAASARQAARFYTLLDAGRLVSKHWSFRMLGLMSPPKHHHKFVGGLAGRKGIVFRARKSGSWRNFHSDSALIQGPNRRYVAVGISESSNGESLMRKLIRVLDDIVVEGAHRKKSTKGK